MKIEKSRVYLYERYTIYMSENEDKAAGLRYNTDKVKLDLLSPIALIGTADVLTFGAKKYDDHNWRKGMKWSVCIGSLLRHLIKFMAGEDLDPESGLPHIDHVACNAMFLQEYFRVQKKYDDRFKPKIEERQ